MEKEIIKFTKEEEIKFMQDAEKLMIHISKSIEEYCRGKVITTGMVCHACADILISALHVSKAELVDMEKLSEEMIKRYKLLLEEGD